MGHGDRTSVPLRDHGHGLEFESDVLGRELFDSGSPADDHQRLAALQIGCFDRDFRNAYAVEPVGDLAEVDLAAGGRPRIRG